jgi:nucleoside-diphosphate-sugar epimerase
MITNNYKLKNSSKYPTSLIIRGADVLGIEIAKSLLEQGGYVIIIDDLTKIDNKKLKDLKKFELLVMLDFSAIDQLDEELRRLDYVFYLHHQYTLVDHQISSQEFLQFSNYLDLVLDLTSKFEAKFILTTSLKAHQIITSDLHMTNKLFKDDNPTGYTEIEKQRYAESLVKEYQEKVGVDSRIVRVGELLGKGIQLNKNSGLIKLILAGIQGNDLPINGDGLETDYYIHYLDAAYGILKAQFAMNTKGKVYSLANREEISILSIAYRLLELLPESKEVIFTEDNDKLPQIKIYKPAENLDVVGWMPRVNFDRALNQSIEYIKNLLEKEKKQIDVDKNDKKDISIWSKFKSIFVEEEIVKDVAENTVDKLENTNLDGILARLVAQRKAQEKARKGSVILANSKLRERVKEKKKRSKLGKFSMFIYDVLIFKLQQKFSFLNNITVADFFVGTIGIVSFFTVYFLIISPLLSLGKNIIMIRVNSSNMVNAINSLDYDASQNYAKNINSNINDSQKTLNKLEFLFDLTNSKESYITYQTTLSSAYEYTSGIEDVFGSLSPLMNIVNKYDPQVIFRINNSQPLTVSNKQDFGLQLDQIEANNRLLNSGIQKIQKSSDSLEASIQKIPNIAKFMLGSDLIDLNNEVDKYIYINNVYKELPLLLGKNKVSNYLIIVQDNARYSAGGGEIVGFVNIAINKGALESLEIININQLLGQSNKVNVNKEVINAINLVSTKDVTQENITINDLAKIMDNQLLMKTLVELYSNQTGKNVDMAMSINLFYIQSLLKEIGNINYQQVEFNSEGMLASINTLIGDSNSQQLRNEIILNLYANILEKQFNNIDYYISSNMFMFASNQYIKQKNYYSANTEIKTLLSKFFGVDQQAKDKLIFGINYNQKDSIFTKYPIMNMTVKVHINKDFTTNKEIVLNVVGSDNFENAFICSPVGARNFTYDDIALELITPTFDSDNYCSLFLANDQLRFVVKYDTLSIENKTDSQQLYSFALEKTVGIDANYDIEFSFDPGLKIEFLDKSYIQQNNKYIYSGIFDGNKIFSFLIE